MAQKGLKIVVPSAVSDPTGLRKLEHYYGIEFLRGASNGGGEHGYVRMIGDEDLLREMRFHNQIRIAQVKDGKILRFLDPVLWEQDEDGKPVDLSCPDGSDIMQVHTRDVYAIVGGSNPTYERFIVSDQPFTYDGEEARRYPAYGESPDYEVIHNGVARSIRDESVEGTQQAGNMVNVQLDLSGIYLQEPFDINGLGTENAGGFPRTGLSRYEFEQYARAKNPNRDSNYPYSNVCNQDLELTAAFMFIEFRTKQLNTIFGHGLSAVAIPNYDAFIGDENHVSGFRLNADDGSHEQYGTFATKVYLNGSSSAVTIWDIINKKGPILKMFEAQLACGAGDYFLEVKNSDGELIPGQTDHALTGCWFKIMEFELKNASLTAGGTPKNWSVFGLLRVPIWRGRTRLWGHLTQWYSGYEAVKFKVGSKTCHLLYRSPDVNSLSTDTDEAVKAGVGKFSFQETYEACGELPPITADGSPFVKEMVRTPDGAITTAVGGTKADDGSLFNYEGAAVYMQAGGESGKYERRGVHFGAHCTSNVSALRYATVTTQSSTYGSMYGSGFRVTLKQ